MLLPKIDEMEISLVVFRTSRFQTSKYSFGLKISVKTYTLYRCNLCKNENISFKVLILSNTTHKHVGSEKEMI